MLCYTLEPSFTAAPHSGTNSCLFRLSKAAHLTASVKLVLRLLQDQSRKCLSTAHLWFCKTPDSGHHVHLFTPNRPAFIPTPTLPSGVNIEFGPCIINVFFSGDAILSRPAFTCIHITYIRYLSTYLSMDIWMEELLIRCFVPGDKTQINA